MAFGSDADVAKLRQLATLGGGDFSAAVCRIPVQTLFCLEISYLCRFMNKLFDVPFPFVLTN
jgi:hypothetical protein